jgi:hypothetical protein
MPRRMNRKRSSAISDRDIELLRNAILEGWPWRLKEDEMYRSIPLDEKLQIILSHLTGVFTLPCGFPTDPHPSDETVASLRSELAADLKQAEKQWGALVPRKDRWHSDDLRARTPSCGGPRETY